MGRREDARRGAGWVALSGLDGEIALVSQGGALGSGWSAPLGRGNGGWVLPAAWDLGSAPKDLEIKGRIGDWRRDAAGGRLDRDTPQCPPTGRPEAPAGPWHGLRQLRDVVIGRKSCHLPISIHTKEN